MQANRHPAHRTRSRAAALALAVAAALALVAAGCGGEGSGSAPTGPAPEATLTAYFPTRDREAIVPVRVPRPAAGGALESALAALAQGPSDPALGPALPGGTRVLGARVEGGTARVDLSGDFAAAYPSGGSAAEIAALAPLVFTATEVPGVERVLVTVEGRTPDVPSQLDLAAPLARTDFPPEIVEARP
jgi:spore germination protein GerM